GDGGGLCFAAGVPVRGGELTLGKSVVGEVDQLRAGVHGTLPLGRLAAQRIVRVADGDVSRIGGGLELSGIVVGQFGGAGVGIGLLEDPVAEVVLGAPYVAGRIGHGDGAVEPVVPVRRGLERAGRCAGEVLAQLGGVALGVGD